jgi:hypothetical protein
MGFRIILRVQPPLVRLLKALPDAEEVQGTDEPLPEADAHAPFTASRTFSGWERPGLFRVGLT